MQAWETSKARDRSPGPNSGHQVQSAGALDLAADLAMQPSRNASHATSKDLAGLGGELGDDLRVLVRDLLERHIQATAGEFPVGFAETDQAFFGLRCHAVKTISGFRDAGCASS